MASLRDVLAKLPDGTVIVYRPTWEYPDGAGSSLTNVACTEISYSPPASRHTARIVGACGRAPGSAAIEDHCTPPVFDATVRVGSPCRVPDERERRGGSGVVTGGVSDEVVPLGVVSGVGVTGVGGVVAGGVVVLGCVVSGRVVVVPPGLVGGVVVGGAVVGGLRASATIRSIGAISSSI